MDANTVVIAMGWMDTRCIMTLLRKGSVRCIVLRERTQRGGPPWLHDTVASHLCPFIPQFLSRIDVLSLIAAMSENRVIGRNGRLPWHLPDDLKWFKQKTMGHHIIMGRKTWESPGHPLPGRTSIIVTRQHGYQAKGAIVVSSLELALARVAPSDQEPFIIGGGEIFAQALPRVDRMYLTIVHATVEGNAFFPPFDERAWTMCEEVFHPSDAKHIYTFTIRTMARIAPRS